METRSIFRNLSPLDHRYYQANETLFESLSDHLSEEALVRYCVRVESALLLSHLDRLGKLTSKIRDQVEKLESVVTPEAVYTEEAVTHHNIRALVRVIQRHLPPDVGYLVHVGATSADILDTANSLRIRTAVKEVVVPVLLAAEDQLISIAESHASTVQIGRTHGQHGVPITLGFAIAEYVSRLGTSIERIVSCAGDLRGKLAGAVGAYNSLSMVTDAPEQFERSCLARLGIEPSDHSTQLIEPEHLLRLLLEMSTAFGILANLADDLRHLQRSEIDEVREFFDSAQVGSSTMPQKRNPWNSEHVKSLWKAFMPRTMTFFMDQISEHQRDLTNSASGRFVSEFIAGLVAAASRMTKVLSSLFVNEDRLQANIAASGDLVLAEAAYTLLASQGVEDAHEDVRKATLTAQEEGVALFDVLKRDSQALEQLRKALSAVSTLSVEEFFSNPLNYTGRAEHEALRLAGKYRSRMTNIREEMAR